LFTTVQGVLSLLDLGLATTLGRELARTDAKAASGQDEASPASIVRTLEIVYGAIGLLAGLAVAAISPLIATSWVKAETLTHTEVTRAIGLMGLTLAFQWPAGLYQNGLMGLQRQIAANLVALSSSILRGVGAVIVLVFFSRSIGAFFAWQAGSALVTTLVSRAVLRASLPRPTGLASFNGRFLRGQASFAVGLTGTAVLAILMTQTDKLLLSRMCSLADFGHYSMAMALANSVYLLVGPISAAAFPRFTQLLALGDYARLRQTYHRTSQLASVIVLAPALTIACLPEAAVVAWTGSNALSRSIAPLVAFLVAGTGLQALVYIPAQLQLAHGLARLGFVTNAGLTAAYVPILLFLVFRFGTLGGAMSWTILGLAYVVVVPIVTHRYVLHGETRRWLFADFGGPLAAILVIVFAARALLPTPSSRLGAMALLALVGGAGIAAAAFSAVEIRQTIVNKMAILWRKI
jgi:O-antigen/teichoic acid export membrane protein